MRRKTKRTETAVAGPGHNSIDRDRLHCLVKRIDSVESGRADLPPISAMSMPRPSPPASTRRQVIRMRKRDNTEPAEPQAVIDEYLAALGDYGTIELGRATIARASGGLMPRV